MKYNPEDYNYIRAYEPDEACITFGGRIKGDHKTMPGTYSGSISIKFLIDNRGGL